MTLECQQGVISEHAVSVVGDADELASAAFHFHTDACSASVQRILQQLLNHRSRAFDDFAGGDLVRYHVREDTDSAHASIVGPARSRKTRVKSASISTTERGKRK